MSVETAYRCREDRLAFHVFGVGRSGFSGAGSRRHRIGRSGRSGFGISGKSRRELRATRLIKELVIVSGAGRLSGMVILHGFWHSDLISERKP